MDEAFKQLRASAEPGPALPPLPARLAERRRRAPAARPCTSTGTGAPAPGCTPPGTAAAAPRTPCTEAKSPRFRNCRASTLKNNSTWFSHEPCLGVKWNTCLCSGSLSHARRCVLRLQLLRLERQRRSGRPPPRTPPGSSACSGCPPPSRTASSPGSAPPRAAGAARKSRLVRVGPRSQTTSPVGTTNVVIIVRVPWRMYSNSRFSGLPGSAGRVGYWPAQDLHPGLLVAAEHQPPLLVEDAGR